MPKKSLTLAKKPEASGCVSFDDSFSNVWAASGDSAIATSVGATLGEMLRAADATGVKVTEVQLDYDCPERLLERWSAVVAQLSLDPLLGRQVWLTSLVAHVSLQKTGSGAQRPRYGSASVLTHVSEDALCAFAGHTAGEIAARFDMTKPSLSPMS